MSRDQKYSYRATPTTAEDPSDPIRQVPLFVDLDGTLVATDTLHECALLRVKNRPLDIFRIPLWLRRGKAYLKARLADDGSLDVGTLPYRDDLLDYIRAERAKRRPIYLATAADRSIAERVADHLGVFDGVLASDGNTNLCGRNKLAAIQSIAPDGFDYAGDSRDDLAVWEAADALILVGASPSVTRQACGERPAERCFTSSRVRLSEWAHALRVHQWMKNLLVFVPLLTSFRIVDVSAVGQAVMAFIAFSFCASSIYVMNDLLDLQSDRAHPRKRFRPFASGRIPLTRGLAASLLAMALGLSIAVLESTGLTVVILCYLAITTSYTWRLKSLVLLDVVVLALLYVVRIIGGSIAIGVPTSVWLLAFALFIFLSLALAKRCSELVSLQTIGMREARGRNYRVEDLQVLWPTGLATGVSSLLVFSIWITNDEDVLPFYASPALLWLVALALFYWLGRVWIKTSRGEMFDDPLVFAVKDAGSRIAIAMMVTFTLLANFLKLPNSEFLFKW